MERRKFLKGVGAFAVTAGFPRLSEASHRRERNMEGKLLPLPEGVYLDSYGVLKLEQNKPEEPIALTLDVSKINDLSPEEAGEIISILNKLFEEVKKKKVGRFVFPYDIMRYLEYKSGRRLDEPRFTYDSQKIKLSLKWYENPLYFISIASGTFIASLAGYYALTKSKSERKREFADTYFKTGAAMAFMASGAALGSVFVSFPYEIVSERYNKAEWLVIMPVNNQEDK